MSPLTKRETEILGRVVRGQKRSTIAEELGITTWTVQFHLRQVRQKFGVPTVLDAVVVSVRLTCSKQ